MQDSLKSMLSVGDLDKLRINWPEGRCFMKSLNELWEILLDLQYTNFILTNSSGLDMEEKIKLYFSLLFLLLGKFDKD